MSRFAGNILFFTLQIVYLPFTVIGFCIVMLKSMKLSKRYNLSSTSTMPLMFRWAMHEAGVRNDPVASKITGFLPQTSLLGIWVTFFPIIIANKLWGYKPNPDKVLGMIDGTTLKLLSQRTLFFDKIIKEGLNDIEQVVFLGAGFDARAFKFIQNRNTTVFELDRESMQYFKKRALKKAGIPHDWINFIPIDFKTESWINRLIENGFDPGKKTFFLWEGVTYYLERDIIQDTLGAVKANSGKGSIISFDFLSEQAIHGKDSWIIRNVWSKVTKRSGEPLVFGFDLVNDSKNSIQRILSKAGLSIYEYHPISWENSRKPPFGGLIQAVV